MVVTPREQAKSERQSQDLDAAAELLARHGYQAVTLQSVGERAGISGPGVYRQAGRASRRSCASCCVGSPSACWWRARDPRRARGHIPGAAGAHLLPRDFASRTPL
ncbi:helix-turn-helix domain-containing protein [Kocuria rhizophila]|nr:helix-turn-helix domain-containing protein [Kocuria rhizophila]